jgi:hypothetical protein
LHDGQPKVFNNGRFLTGEFGRRNGQHSSVTASNSPALFFAPFFWANKRKEGDCFHTTKKVKAIYYLSCYAD